MSKRRRSLQALLIPSFNRQRSNTELLDYPPLDFASPAQDLLDDDPFANLNSPTVPSKPTPSSPPPTLPPSAHLPPKSPLSVARSPPPAPSPPLPSKRHAIPAHRRPAFSPRPSLPSLHALAKMSVVMPRKVRKGKVGAGLPSEPWDNCPSEPLPCLDPAPLTDFTSELDCSDHEEGFTEDEEDSILDTYAALSSDYPTLDGDNSIDHSQHTLPRRLSASLLSDHFRTPSLSPERPFVAWPVLDPSLQISPDSEISTPGFPEFDTYSTTSTSPPTTESEDSCCTSTSSEHSFEDDTLTGTSVDTIRAPLHTWPNHRTLSVDDSDIPSEMNDTTDGNHNWRGRPIFYPSSGGSSPRADASRTTHHPSSFRDNTDHHRHPRRSSISSTSSESESEKEEEEENDNSRRCVGVPHEWKHGDSSAANSEDDDIPLAQRIPTALHAQKTIRKQVRDERDQRRKERWLKRMQQQQSPLPPGSAPQPRLSRKSLENEQARGRHDTLRPTAPTAVPTTSPAMPAFPSSSQDAAIHATQTLPHPRARTQTLPGRPFAPIELSNKLTELPMSPAPASTLTRKPTRTTPAVPVPPLPKEPAPMLRHARSFHRPTPRTTDVQPPLPLARALTRSKSTTRPDEGRRRPSAEFEPPLPVPVEGAQRLGRKKSTVRRGGADEEVRPPPLPTEPPVPLVTHKIFIGDLQQFHMVHVAPNTNAKDIIITMQEQSILANWSDGQANVNRGGWMLWEVCQDFGMERPIRTFELILDVAASWKDKTANNLVLKMTPLAPLLSRSNLPSSSPVCSGYIEYEHKRGKWAKRFLRLRENNLYLAKRDSGKDEVFLCSLSNFDGYMVTRSYKAPKPFVFAIKSTDNLTFFENTADYLHVFSCHQKDGDNWMEKILLARSYVLYQEKNILFTAQPAVAGPSTGLQRSNTVGLSRSNTTGLQRSGTRRTTPHGLPSRNPAPLVDVAPAQIFEPGSLLHAKHA